MLTKENPVIHRYPWTFEEKSIIAFFALIAPVVSGIVYVTQDKINLVLVGVLTAITWTIVGLLIRLGKKRKDGSQLSAYVDNNVLFVTGFNLDDKNAAPIKSIHSVSTKKHGIADSFVFKTRGAAGRTVIVPQRIAQQDGLREVVLAMYENAPEKAASAITLAESIKNSAK